MKRPPRRSNAPVLTNPVAIRLIVGGLCMAIATLITVAYGDEEYTLPVALTMGMVTLSILHLIAAVTTRNPDLSVISLQTLVNRRFVYMCLMVIGLTVLVTELGILQRIFETVSLTGRQWGICLLGPAIILVVFELAKVVLNHTGWLSVTPPAQVASAASASGD